MAQVALPATRVSRGSTDVLARFGLTARAFVYVVMGWLGLQIARGRHPQQANQRGAFAEVAHGTGGRILMWIVCIGLGAYALWRLRQAALGPVHRHARAGERWQMAARGLIYAALCVSTVKFITGTSRKGQAQQQETFTARLMRDQPGRWLVGVVGAIVVLVGLFLIVEGILRKFERELRTEEMSPGTRKVVSGVGAVGSVARGVVFGVAGGLVVAAAVTFDPGKSTGLDGALRTLAAHSYGPWLVGALAVGLIAFGLYGLAAARWAKT